MLADRYRLGSVIGTGGMAAVLAAEHVASGEHVAVKFLHPDSARDEEAQQRFLREARISSLIECEHVVKVLDVGITEPSADAQSQGLFFLVMEYLRGEDLGARVEREGALPMQLAVDCTLQAAEALALAHAAGIVHRDIKPSNLWLTAREDGTPLLKVLDFGISKLLDQNADAKLTETTSVFGSPMYMSPEQIRSAKRVDARADIWALGVVFHELLTGEVPFQGDNVGGVLASITADPPIRVRDVRPELPVVLEELVLACLEKDPARRITLHELAAELRAFASNTGTMSAGRITSLKLTVPLSSGEWRTRLSRPPAPPSFASSTLSASSIQMLAPKKSRAPLYVGMGVAGAVVLGLGALYLRRPDPTQQLLLTTGSIAPPAISTLPVPSAASSQVLTVQEPAPTPSASAPTVETVPSEKPIPTTKQQGGGKRVPPVVSAPPAPAPAPAPPAPAPAPAPKKTGELSESRD